MNDLKIFDKIERLIVELDDEIDGLQQRIEVLESEINSVFDHKHILECVIEREKCNAKLEDYFLFKKKLMEIIYV